MNINLHTTQHVDVLTENHRQQRQESQHPCFLSYYMRLLTETSHAQERYRQNSTVNAYENDNNCTALFIHTHTQMHMRQRSWYACCRHVPSLVPQLYSWASTSIPSFIYFFVCLSIYSPVFSMADGNQCDSST